MKAILRSGFYCLAILLCLNIALPLRATNDDGEKTIVVSGFVKDKETKRALNSVNVTIQGTNIGTVTNAQGKFKLRIPVENMNKMLEVSHIGYTNSLLPLNTEKTSNLSILLVPYTSALSEIIIYTNNPRQIVEDAIRKIPVNYSAKNNLLTAFYRETIQKRNRYIGVSEAIIDVYKTPYDNRNPDKDKVQIQKGRRIISQKSSDTLAVKLAGGPTLPIYMDVVKNENLFLNSDDLRYYDFWMEEPATINDKLQLVIGFRPMYETEIAMLRGKIFIDRDQLAITRAEFGLDMRDKAKAIQSILIRKPMGLRFHPQEMSYIVTYNTRDGKSHLNYVCNVIRFKCDWKKKLFSTGYSVNTEMVVTDRNDNNIKPIPSKEAFGNKDVFYDMVDNYWSENFWKDYNIIEPTESLENAVSKLKKQLD